MPLVNSVPESVVKALQKGGVIPDVIDVFSTKAVVQATYGPGKEVQLGGQLRVDETQELPKVQVTVSDVPKDAVYTLALTDPDAPRRGDPTWSEYAHYLVTDIKLDPAKASQPQEIDFSKAKTLLSYIGPAPPAKTGLHRYVFLLFEGRAAASGIQSENRANWGFGKPGAGIREWLKGNDLDVVGANFFEAENVEQ